MANRRALKRTINLISEELFAECVAASLYGYNCDCGKSLIFTTIKMQDNFIRRVSHPEPGMSAKLYYKDLKEQFAIQVNDILDHIHFPHKA